MKQILMEQLFYGLFFAVMTFIVLKHRKRASKILYVGLFLFWLSFILQLTGFIWFGYIDIYSKFNLDWYIISFGGMATSVIMMIHAYLSNVFEKKDKEHHD